MDNEWTLEKPTRPGAYWYATPESTSRDRPWLVEVNITHKCVDHGPPAVYELDQIRVHQPGTTRIRTPEDLPGHWLGPLAKPNLPGA